MKGKGSIIAKILIITGIAVCAAAAVMMICKKMKGGKGKKKELDMEQLDKEAFEDFEECCDACYSDSDY